MLALMSSQQIEIEIKLRPQKNNKMQQDSQNLKKISS
jgi:hypothetical protein